MKQWMEIRPRVLKNEASKRAILRERGMHGNPVESTRHHPGSRGTEKARNWCPNGVHRKRKLGRGRKKGLRKECGE